MKETISAAELRQKVAAIIDAANGDIGGARADLFALRKEYGISQEKLDRAIRANQKLAEDEAARHARLARFFERLMVGLPPGKTVREHYAEQEVARIAAECGVSQADMIATNAAPGRQGLA